MDNATTTGSAAKDGMAEAGMNTGPLKERGGPTLIVGGDSGLGQRLVRRYAAIGQSLIASSRRPPRSSDWLHLDLADEPTAWRLPDQVGTAYLLAAITSQAVCAADPERAMRVNLHHTVALGKALLERGAHLVFVSTNHVFNGASALRQPDEPPVPLTEYGRIKACAETRLRALGSAVTVLRLSKVVDPQTTLICGWLSNLRSGKPVAPFLDARISPVSAELAVEALWRLGEDRIVGIHQLSALEDVSYAAIARRLARLWDLDEGLVRPTTTEAAKWQGEPFPQHTTLDSRSLNAATGIVAPHALAVVDSLFGPTAGHISGQR